MSPAPGAVGRRWERAASEYLARRGLEVLDRGYRCRLGELDLVCRDGAVLVVVEVKARSEGALVGGRDSIGRAKRYRLVQATRHYLMRHRVWQGWPLRFDVVVVNGIDTEEPDIEWIRNAFDAG